MIIKDGVNKCGSGKKKILMTWPIKVTSGLKDLLKQRDVTLVYFSDKYFSELKEKIPSKFTIYGEKTTKDLLDDLDSKKWYSFFLSDVCSFLKEEKIDAVWAQYYFFSFKAIKRIRRLGVKMVAPFADDPEDTKIISSVFGPEYEGVVCAGVQYNSTKTIVDVLLNKGCTHVRFIPIFPDPEHYDLEDIDYSKKDLDVVYVGGLVWKKWRRLSALYSAFGKKLNIYSKYDPRKRTDAIGLLFKLLNRVYPLPEVLFLSDSDVKNIYKRAKIGFNCHTSWGPSNSRTYELCLNGVLQVTDNAKGMSRIFSVGTEVLCYNNMLDAKKIIRKYLKQTKHREEIAKKGYLAAKNKYTYERVFELWFDFTFNELSK